MSANAALITMETYVQQGETIWKPVFNLLLFRGPWRGLQWSDWAYLAFQLSSHPYLCTCQIRKQSHKKFLINFSCELGQIMTRYDFQEARWVILSNVRTDYDFTWFHFLQTFHMNLGKLWSDMTSKRLDELFWAMFEPTTTLPDFTFGHHFISSGANND